MTEFSFPLPPPPKKKNRKTNRKFEILKFERVLNCGRHCNSLVFPDDPHMHILDSTEGII